MLFSYFVGLMKVIKVMKTVNGFISKFLLYLLKNW